MLKGGFKLTKWKLLGKNELLAGSGRKCAFHQYINSVGQWFTTACILRHIAGRN
jgi:hypothetical protein